MRRGLASRALLPNFGDEVLAEAAVTLRMHVHGHFNPGNQ
jgi:hypothetical protein